MEFGIHIIAITTMKAAVILGCAGGLLAKDIVKKVKDSKQSA